MNTRVFEIGQVLECGVSFIVSSTQTLADPTNVFFKVEDPSGNAVTYQYGVGGTIIKTSTGVYTADVPLDEWGTWKLRWYSTGARQASIDETITVKQSIFS